MVITDEQRAIIDSNENIVVNAGAGSGKTSTLLEYARKKLQDNPSAKILYLVYNKEMKKEAVLKFKGLNVVISTIHSYAYQYLCKLGKKPFLGNLIKSEVEKALAASTSLNNEKYKSVLKYVEYIDSTANDPSPTHPAFPLFDKFKNRQTPQSHNNYLKEFCKIGMLNYDYVLIDEAQDLNINVLHMLENQNATKVYVGDTNQAIYMKLNNTINVFKLVDHKEFKLTQSFRSSDDCLIEANAILKHKFNNDSYFLKGMSEGKSTGKFATLSLTNTGVFNHAIVTMGRKLSFYINTDKLESAIKTITEIDNTFSKNKHHAFYSRFASNSDLRKYAYSVEDFELADACTLYEKYKANAVSYLHQLAKENDPTSNYMILTVHGSKGLEFDVVDYKTLFFRRKDIQKGLNNKNEEIINLTYVAATRASKINI